MNDVKYRFFLKAGESTGGSLPYGYQHVEYLQSSGTQYIDTGLKPIANEVAEVDFRFTSVPSSLQIFFGSRVTSSSKRYLLGCGTFSGIYKYYCALGDDPNVQIANADTQRHTLKLSTVNGTVSIDGGTAMSAGTFIDNNLNIHVFGLNQNGTSSYRATMRIYGVRLGTRSRLMPARRLSDNVLGMYDTRRNIFLTNAGTGTFTAGAVVEDWTEVHPIWKDDLSVDYGREGSEMFHRAQLSGNLVFVRDDFHLIYDIPFGEEFRIKIQESVNFGASWTDYWQGKFFITDCTVNVDDRRITVKPTVYDRYNAILAGMEKEYDLIRLTPEMQRFLVRKRPVIQIYTEGDDTISCFVGRLHYEQDVDMPSDVDNPEAYLRDDCHFAVMNSFAELNFTDYPSGEASHFQQPYAGLLAAGSHLTNVSDNTYYIEYFERIEMRETGGGNVVPYYINGLEVCPRGTSTVYWLFEQERPVEGYKALPVEITLTDQGSHGGDLVCTRSSVTVYGRIVCNVEYLGHEHTEPLYSNDLVPYNRNYRRATGFDESAGLVQTQQYSTTPTRWGQRDDGTYFCPPNNDERYIPIGQSKWVNSSTWYLPSYDVEILEMMGRDAYTMGNAYPLASCISVLLDAMGAGVTFADSPTYSEFLFNVSQSDPIAGRPTRLYLTPKSNITAGEYQTPAQTCKVTLKSILDMLRNTYRLYWFVDDSNRLRIEHIEWFRRGGTYSGQPSVGIDLTQMVNPRNGKAWSFGTSEYKFEKIQMPERYQFGWMDKTTDAFDGKAIDVLSPYVEAGRVEEIMVGDCTTDIDFMLLNPSSVSPDGVVLMTGEQASAVTETRLTAFGGQETEIMPVASYVSGKSCLLTMLMQGSGQVTIVWYVGSRRVVSQYVINVSLGAVVYSLTVPEGTRGMSFLPTATFTVDVSALRPASGDTMLQMPFVEGRVDNLPVTMQNGYLSFLKLQDPYWLYNMPASSVEVNGVVTASRGVQRMKRQTVSVPVGVADPATTILVRTGIGDGTIEQMSVRLTSRMAKITLGYDTE